MGRVRFRDWLFDVDVDRTREVFAKAEGGGSDNCICDFCKNYRAQKPDAFPGGVHDLLRNLGIDYRKECETYTTQKLEGGKIEYRGWFHFAGTMLDGPSGKRQLSENSYTVDLKAFDENFQIGFTDDRDLTFFNEIDSIVQVEFAVGLPWVIEAPEPDEV